MSSWLVALSLALGCVGCVPGFTGSKQVMADKTPPAKEVAPPPPTPAPTAKDDGPKRKAKPLTEVSYGAMKETEADSEAAKKNPEAQARLRDEARIAYQQALKTDPNCLEAQKHLGRLYTKMADYERALEIYKQVLPNHPKDASLWYDLGMCHHRRKDFNESARCFGKALEIEPENRDYLKKVGLTLAWLGQTDKAMTYLTRAQGPVLAHCNIAGLLLSRGQRDQALQHVRQAERINPDLPQVRELLADLGQAPATPARVATK